jgi:mRNA interferase MazF
MVDFGEPVGHEQDSETCSQGRVMEHGRRPAVIVSSDRMNGSRAGLVIVVPITTKRWPLPSHVELDPADSGLREISYAKCEDIKSISTERLVRAMGKAAPHALHRIEHSITILLDLP